VEEWRKYLLYRPGSADGWKTMRKTVRKWIFSWQDNQDLKDSHRSGRLSKITCEIADYLDEQLKEDDKLIIN